MRAWIFILLCFTTPVIAGAQFGDVAGNNATLQLQPLFPEPYSEFTVTLEDYRSNSRASEIAWFQNGERVTTQNGDRTVTLKTGAPGELSSVEARLLSPSGVSESIKHSIRPVYLDIIIEPQTHVPTFYKGRSLASLGSTVNATALLEGTSVSARDLLFTWQVNETILNQGPVRGGTITSFAMPPDTRVTLIVNVATLDGRTIARQAFTLKSARPLLRFYEVNTLYGISHHPTSLFNLIANSATLRAEPYYLDSTTFNNPDIADWQVDGNVVGRQDNPYEITLQRASSEQGAVPVSFHVRSTTQILQGVKNVLTLQF